MAHIIAPQTVSEPNGIYEFKKEIHIEKKENWSMNIFAQSRYILYINGGYICEGPCRSAQNVRFFDTVKTDAFLCGKNEITVKVMHVSTPLQFSTVFKSMTPAVLCEFFSESHAFGSDETWECYFLKNYKLQNTLFTAPYEEIGKTEREPLAISCSGNYSFSGDFISPCGIVDMFEFKPRPIPMIYPMENVKFSVVKKGENFIEFDAGRYVTAKPSFEIAKGHAAKIIYSECYVFSGEKGIRDDSDGEIEGYFDFVHAQDRDFCFEPFWLRSFRYIRIEVECIESALKSASARLCRYPLEIDAEFECSDPYYNKMYEISENTMLCCMHEIFVDCPYYEQQQYIMDSAIESAVLMRMSGDVRLVRKCIGEFAASQQPSGLLCANYPSAYVQIIPGFSFFFVFLLKDYLEYSNDISFVREYLGTVDKIFEYFENNLNGDSLITKSEYWDFADWVPEWKNGVPVSKKGETITLYNLYYAAALKSAEFICKKAGRSMRAAEYSERYQRLCADINRVCFDEKRGLYRDSDCGGYSAHTIIWAVLSGIAEGENAQKMIEKIFDADISKSSFSMNFYLFRALEKCGYYKYVPRFFEGWRKMLDLHCTTWCENPDSPRSECHGWSSAPLYEFSANLLGVKYSCDDVLTIAPAETDLEYCRGCVPSRFGKIKIERTQKDGYAVLRTETEEGIKKRIILPDGREYVTDDRVSEFSYKLK